MIQTVCQDGEGVPFASFTVALFLFTLLLMFFETMAKVIPFFADITLSPQY